MFVVRFIRRDKTFSEEYYYNDACDAFYHLSLFKDDDFKLYKSIDLLQNMNGKEVLICSLRKMKNSR